MGKVILAGAGPGHPDLITVSAARYLQQASVVLTDRLVSDELLERWVNPAAKLVYVGKQCRKGSSTSQETINALLVRYARQGKLVVRLKGGDASLFSNILDELKTLHANSIPFEIIPGVTAALGAAAFAGIPLTARGYSTAVRILTYYKPENISEANWQELAACSDTLVFYMSGETIYQVVEKLIFHGADKNNSIAIIEQATTPNQVVYQCGLYDFIGVSKKLPFQLPSLAIIGKVASLHQQFGWVPNSNCKDPYFTPVANMRKPTTAHRNLEEYVSRA